MVLSPTVKALLDLERSYEQQVTKYSEALKGIRKLLKLEQGDTEEDMPAMEPITKRPPILVVRGDLPHNFSTFKKSDAVKVLLKLDGSLSAQDIFEEMKAAKHAVKSKASLVTMLSSSEAFKFEDGKWSLAESAPFKVPEEEEV